MYKKIKFLIILVLLLSITPINGAMAEDTPWTSFPSMESVPLDKTFTVLFNKPVTLQDIKSIEILQESKPVPVKVITKDNKALVTPESLLKENTSYELRVQISKKKYQMKFKTIGKTMEQKISYEGIKDVSSIFSENQLIKGLHHYTANLGEGHPINIYVTDDYEKKYGKGFSYDETISIVNSISEFRNTKPYTTRLGTLDIFFYTNESNTPLPSNYQAVIGSRQTNNGDGTATEMLMNASTMPYDFRSSYVHEFIHYFDYQSFINEYPNPQTFEKYWGPNYRFWLLEGGAEYGGYFFYDYPENTKNNLRKDFVENTKESILKYAKSQGGGKKDLLYDVELNSFDDINLASSNNYGITLSLFWYLVEQYGYDHVYDYVKYIADNFKGKQTISIEDKKKTAIRFFNKTEEEVLQDWLTYFNYFGGELQEYKETTIGTANHIFSDSSTLLPPSLDLTLGNLIDGRYKFALNISEWIPEVGDPQAYSFREKSTKSFQLVSENQETVNVVRDDGFFTERLTNGDQLYAFDFFIPVHEVKKIKKGIEYKIVPVNNDSPYKWVIPDNIIFKW